MLTSTNRPRNRRFGSGEVLTRRYGALRVRQVQFRPQIHHNSRLLTLDQEIEGSNPSSPANPHSWGSFEFGVTVFEGAGCGRDLNLFSGKSGQCCVADRY
jgi:hypothetical protein